MWPVPGLPPPPALSLLVFSPTHCRVCFTCRSHTADPEHPPPPPSPPAPPPFPHYPPRPSHHPPPLGFQLSREESLTVAAHTCALIMIEKTIWHGVKSVDSGFRLPSCESFIFFFLKVFLDVDYFLKSLLNLLQ